MALNHFGDESRKILHYASKPTLLGYIKASDAVKNNTILRTLVQEMPYFERPLALTTRYFSSKVAVNLYLELTSKLNIESWAEQINYHLETVSDAYDGITEKLFYHKALVIEIFLEFFIVFILLIDFYEAYTNVWGK